ncbi:unnamed protein product [Acanthoscelides obtectus]|uniref:Rad21/Rec8-like protein N-terminal domain-containing protein n=1 Tax=Acanthoscelides obtectus TaxID=200917 RepID=A0A9P0P777_ACAOB|nr:unnamed protein product [Acanthoscelides obtectus]CAK1635715.1 Double-strand-break repair protein rad21 homolog [Acanthoscelides obtectus]
MFYAHFVLAKKGPLARIWLAAHWDKKLTKAHVFETNIEKSVDGILQPKVKMALRTSGHLLLGVVRIYSRKAKYLLADCNEAFVKIKMAFRPGMVDLPEEHREAAVNAITLPEVFHDFDTTMPELADVDIEAQFSLNNARAEEITMREDIGTISLVGHDEGFGDMGFDTEAPELMRHAPGLEPSMEPVLFTEPVLDSLDKEREPVPSTSSAQLPEAPMEMESGVREMISGGLFEGGLFDETPMGDVPPVEPSIPQPEPPPPEDSDDDMGGFDGPPSVGPPSSPDSRPTSTLPPVHQQVQPPTAPTPVPPEEPPPPSAPTPIPPEEEPAAPVPAADQTTLLRDDEESFALAPVDATALRDEFYLGLTKSRKKRKLIVDEVKNISGEEMKNQLSDTSDIVTTLDLAPPTKRLMHWKETGGVEKLFALPARLIPARILFKAYQRHLTLRSIGTEDFTMLGDPESLQIDQARDQEENTPQEAPTPTRRGRKRKAIEEPPPTPISHLEETPHLSAPSMEEHQMPPTPLPPGTPAPQTPAHYDQMASQLAAEQILPPGTPSIPGMMGPGTPGMLPCPTPSMMGPGTPMMQPQTPGMMQPQTPMMQPQTPGMMQPQTPGMMQPQTPMMQPPTPGMMQPQTPMMQPQTPGIMGTPAHDMMGGGEMYSQTPVYPEPPTPLPHMEEMPHLPPDQVRMILQEQEDMAQAAEALLNAPSHLGAHDLPAMDAYDDHERPASPWDYEYDQGPSEEQQKDETDEQFEERVLNKRAYQLFTLVRRKFQLADKILLDEMCQHNTKKQVSLVYSIPVGI